MGENFTLLVMTGANTLLLAILAFFASRWHDRVNEHMQRSEEQNMAFAKVQTIQEIVVSNLEEMKSDIREIRTTVWTYTHKGEK